MNTTPSQGVKTFYLIFGIVEFLVAALWCLAGAGIYGSPLAIFRGQELMHVLAFLSAGPFSVLPAAILALWQPRWGAIWLIVGGLISAALAVPYFSTDASVLPLILASLPMFIAGIWLIRASTLASREQMQPAEQASGSEGQQVRRDEMDLLPRVLLFLAAWIGTDAVLIVLVYYNVTGLRGPRLSNQLFAYENETLANGVVLLLLAGVVGFMSFVRKRLRLRAEFVAGMWIALLLGGLVIVLE